MLILTTPKIVGEKVVEHKGLVTGDSMVGANLYKDMLSNVKDVVHKKESDYAATLAMARKLAIESMEEKAEKLGANAIIGTRVTYNHLGGQMGNTIVVNVAGTAVVTDKKTREKKVDLSHEEVEPEIEASKPNLVKNEPETSSVISNKELATELHELNKDSSEDQIKLDYFSYDINERLDNLETQNNDEKLNKVIDDMNKKNNELERKINKKM